LHEFKPNKQEGKQMAAKYKVVGLGKMGVVGMDAEKKEFDEIGVEVEVIEVRPKSEDELIAVARDADVILGGSPFFTPRVMKSLPKCQVLATYSVGYDFVDVEAATKNRIIVVNNPASEWCVEEVSNHAVALLLACAKKLTILHDLTRKGRWKEAKQAQGSMASIHGQTVGIIGCGEIGRMTARKLQCFGLKTIGYDPYLDKKVAGESGITLMSMPEVLKQSDFISVHTYLSNETTHLLGEKEFRQMKPSVYFINTSRGKVVDEPALIKALQEKRIAGAGLDVFEQEPVDPANPLLKMDNVTVMPHSASYSDAALIQQAVNPAQEVARVLSGKWPNHPVNRNVNPKKPLK
jgi:D-3-phosphoglycerate dehydrogenase